MSAHSKVNIQIIFQKHEVDVTYRAIDSLLGQSGGLDITISVLLNSSPRPDIRTRLSDFASVRYYEAGSNLGVAGGRNVLLQTEESKASDLIFFVDNDAIVTSDYISTIVEFLHSHPEAGVVGAVSLKYSQMQAHLDDIGIPFTGYLGTDIWAVQNAQVAHFLKFHGTQKLIDHIGTNKDWRASYLEGADSKDLLLHYLNPADERKFYSFNAADKRLAQSVLRGDVEFVEVSNIAGCCQAFRRELLEEIGLLNNLFNFYGFEDVDFCVRALKAGYTNYTVNGCYMFHGTDTRHTDRTTPTGARWKKSNESRARTIFEYLHGTEDFPIHSLRRLATRSMLSGYWADRTGEDADRLDDLYYAGVGFQQGVTQLREAFDDEFDRVVQKGCERHQIDLGGKSLASLPQIGRNSKIRDSRPLKDLIQRSQMLTFEEGFNAGLRMPGQSDPSLSQPFDFKKLSRFKDIHKGERCFIIGNGPSLNKVDFSLLQNEVTFGVNGLFYMTDDIGFRPTYYAVEDNHVVYDNLERIRDVEAQAKFFPEKYREVLGDQEDTFYLPVDWSFYFRSNKFFETPQFTDDIAKSIFVGQTVTYLNMQLAYFMGFAEVYLVGLDFSYEIPQNDPVEGFTITSQDDDPNHFHPAYFGKGKKWHFPKLHNCLKSYRHAGERFEQDGRKIYNATYGGKLECYDRVEFGDLFDNFVQLSKPNDRFTWRLHQLLKQGSQVKGSAVALGLAEHRLVDAQALVRHYLNQDLAQVQGDNLASALNDDSLVLADLATLEADSLDRVFSAGSAILANAAKHEAGESAWLALLDALGSILDRHPPDKVILWHNDVLAFCDKTITSESKFDFNVPTLGRVSATDMLNLSRDPAVHADRLLFSPIHIDGSGRWTDLNERGITALIERHVPFVLAPEGIFA